MADKEKERRYLQQRRASGGGECGVIQKVSGNICEIRFKDKEDQERVLQRKDLTISLPGGEAQLTVSPINPAETLDQPKTSQAQTLTKTNMKSLEKIYHLDVFLLRYMRDNPKALTYLQKQLSSIGCEVELKCDEEQAVVRGDMDKGPGGAFGGDTEKWEQQMNLIITTITEEYNCYHVNEEKQVQVLLQDLSFVNEDIKVYADRGYPVIVGKAEAVKERVAILTKSLPIRKEKPITENQLKLIEEEFCCKLRAHYPDVQLSRGKGIIVLEGLEDEVQSGATKLDELIGQIKERKIQFPTPLLNFINLSGAISKYQARFQQSFRNHVSIEMRPDLVLSSLSADALDEVQAALVIDLNVSTIQLQGAAAVSPHLDKLKDILNQAQSKANRDELRVGVSFIPGINGANRVQLVGYSASVFQFKDFIQDYQMNQVMSQDTVYLSNPKFADCFDKILGLTGINVPNVTFNVFRLPNPCVILSGPHCKVQEVKYALFSALASLTSDTLVLEGSGAQQYYQASGKDSKELLERSFRVIIREQQCVSIPDVKSKQRSSSSPMTLLPRLPVSRHHSRAVGGTATAHNVSCSLNKANVAIKLGSLEDEQVNVLVVPMVNIRLTSTQIGNCLLKKAGNALKSKLDSLALNCRLAPGDILQVDGPPLLGCSKIFFIECLPWDGVGGMSVQALGKALRQCMDLCNQLGLSSLAFPIIGPGILLRYPPSEAVQVLTDAVCEFGSSASSSSLSTIHIIIKPGYPDSDELYRDLYQHLSMNQGSEEIFRSLTSDLDEITIKLEGGVKLRMIFGDITDETTDLVVNTTDFTNFDLDGVCKCILAAAGPEVKEQLKTVATIYPRTMVFTQPGRFPCKAILHVCGEKSASHIEKISQVIVMYCEANHYTSVAIPAICAGAGGLQPRLVAGAILRGIRSATTFAHFHTLRDIRLILYKMDVFLSFQEEAMQIFSTAVYCTGALPETQLQERRLSASADLSILSNSLANRHSAFLFLGFNRKSVGDAKLKLRDLYQKQCSTHTFRKEELDSLMQDDVTGLIQLIDTQGLSIQIDQSGNLSLSGQKDGVTHAVIAINAILHGNLRREMRIKEEEELYTRVVWCIMSHNGLWQRLPKTANYNLEKQDIARGIVDAQGVTWTVDLNSMEATNLMVAEPRKLKRLENLPDFTMPLYWDSMAPGEKVKVVAVPPSSAEYRALKNAFRKTESKTVMKIERLQNTHLRRAYEVQKRHISEKNKQEGGAREKLLYHGSTKYSCDSISTTGFNRRFCGQNGTAYGAGVYFAVNASYSANVHYSKPAADKSQVMFVARVLTGIYTQGNSSMNVPPPRVSWRPHDRFDSVVDQMDKPQMYIVFHDSQAYPDYLITFK
ncbi:protein mono-ADP-ribosyltransferase PARP14-like isoform X2 [Salarias fasciatus]|uniref:protein mono-ADP-ribosyltransferase PARP14-like isoform X2 n=1 Tax=Salarias fasciatus TaxID=181472 RepID=UPI00117697BE|nr:protein mono-ADP-ribosyltransferase PARP14-like isoform X2 [Salarias fasciatus]